MTLSQSIRLMLLGSATLATAHADELQPVNVTADFYDTPALELGSSVSVFDDISITERGASHLEQLLNLAPNVNYSSGASRGRFIQIRGIGERAEYSDIVNPSVGVIIDGIDFTGISTAASLMDVNQVEVLRGPQGTLYGANALAGLINIRSNAPSEETEGYVGATLGNYNTRILKGAVGGTISDSLSYRLSAQGEASDGYTENTYLDRDDTNNIDESGIKGKLNWQPNDKLSVDFTAFSADVDNGYDAFSLDNNRETMSDSPGHDKQETTAASIQAAWEFRPNTELQVNVSRADSDLDYGYDEDWSYIGMCDALGCPEGGYGEYATKDRYVRDNKNSVLDVRAVHGTKDSDSQWVAGVYSRTQDIDLTRLYTDLFDNSVTTTGSEYETQNTALYGQFEKNLTSSARVVAGLRVEQYDADYSDTGGFTSSPDDDLVGGKLGLEYKLNEGRMVYWTLSQGYKAPGFNADSRLDDDQKSFGSETLTGFETGIKGRWMNGRLTAQASVFYQDRKDMQVRKHIYVPVSANNPSPDWILYTTNSSSGSNYGMETEFSLQVNDKFNLSGAVGLLRTEINDFIYADGYGGEYDASGRDQAHAPEYQFSLAGNYLFTPDWLLHVGIEGKDQFYYSDSHDLKSDEFTLLNAKLSYFHDSWELSLWGRNLTDKEHQVRGFGFGNDPRDDYASSGYYQLAEPRVMGVSAQYTF